jgi:lipoate-protein ligase A
LIDSRMNTWRLLAYSVNNAAENMAVDEAIFKGVDSGVSPPTVRFYGWERPAVSLGASQTLNAVNLDACRRLGVSVVPRITGGKAVLHHQELTYSLVAGIDFPGLAGNIEQSFIKIHNCLRKALLEFSAPVATLERVSQPSVESTNCFCHRTHWEISASGKKLVGSAQKRTAATLIQHGSILVDFSPWLMANIFAKSCFENEINELKRVYRRSICSLADFVSPLPDIAQLSEAAARHLSDGLNVKLVPDSLSSRENKLAAEIYTRKVEASLMDDRGATAGI